MPATHEVFFFEFLGQFDRMLSLNFARYAQRVRYRLDHGIRLQRADISFFLIRDGFRVVALKWIARPIGPTEKKRIALDHPDELR